MMFAHLPAAYVSINVAGPLWDRSLDERERRVAAEITDAPKAIRDLFSDLLTLKPEILATTPEALALADAYQQHGILTPKFYADGIHIALATIAEVDLLVSWNFKHIVHYDKIRLFAAVNVERGYKPLAIFSPREVASDEENNY